MQARREILALTGVRGFAALWVVAHHLRPSIEVLLPGWGHLHNFLHFGYLGVDLFAFLSGFVIAYNYAGRVRPDRPRDVGRYLWIRLARIFPLHWFMLAVFLAARVGVPDFGSAPFEADRWGARDLVEHVLMVHGWGVAEHYAWNMPSWTVSAEWLCYLLFPLLVVPVLAITEGGVALAAAAGVLGATKLALDAVGYSDFSANISWGAVRIGGEFLVGMLLWRAWSLGSARRVPWGVAGVVLFAAAILLTRLGSAFPIVCCFGLGVFALAHQRGPLDRALSWRPIYLLGEISYSIYMTHWFVLRAVNYTIGRGIKDAGGLALLVAVTVLLVLAFSALTYRFVEQPARRLLRGWVAPPAPSPHAAPGVGSAT